MAGFRRKSPEEEAQDEKDIGSRQNEQNYQASKRARTAAYSPVVDDFTPGMPNWLGEGNRTDTYLKLLDTLRDDRRVNSEGIPIPVGLTNKQLREREDARRGAGETALKALGKYDVEAPMMDENMRMQSKMKALEAVRDYGQKGLVEHLKGLKPKPPAPEAPVEAVEEQAPVTEPTPEELAQLLGE